MKSWTGHFKVTYADGTIVDKFRGNHDAVRKVTAEKHMIADLINQHPDIIKIETVNVVEDGTLGC